MQKDGRTDRRFFQLENGRRKTTETDRQTDRHTGRQRSADESSPEDVVSLVLLDGPGLNGVREPEGLRAQLRVRPETLKN